MKVPQWIRRKAPLHRLTTLGVGGEADFLGYVCDCDRLRAAIEFAAALDLPVVFLGEGSNVLCSDRGHRGLILKGGIGGIRIRGRRVEAGAACSLLQLIETLNRNRLGGMERLYGIPGSVGGAVVGNAGAYGQEISDTLVDALVFRNGGIERWPAARLGFGYRSSMLKECRNAYLVECRFRMTRSDEDLKEISRLILQKRLPKYPPGMRCPGSFFKNVLVEELSPRALDRVPPDFIQFGKIPAGKLLQAVGACGARQGGAGIADYHGNLVFNSGTATAKEIEELAMRFAEKVQARFQIRLEPEIRILRPDSGWRPANSAGTEGIR